MSTAVRLLIVVVSLASVQCRSPTTVYLVRHAEKALDQGDDPDLTEIGRTRAQALVGELDGVRIDAVFATQYRRTQQTVQPLASARGLPVQIVQAHDNDGFVERLQSYRGKRVLVAGHWNTLPELMRTMGVRERIEIGPDNHSDLFVVTIADDGVHTTLERRRYEP